METQTQVRTQTPWVTPLERGGREDRARDNLPRARGINGGDVVVAYDLPSEHIRRLGNDDNKRKVRNLRLRCVYRLHGLGLQTTESVILVPSSRRGRIEGVINYVRTEYGALELELRDQGIDIELVPLIEVIPITIEQRDRFRVLAERRLREFIDRKIDEICRLLEQIEEITERARRRELRYRYNRLNVEFVNLHEAARELGIDLERDFEYIFNLLDTTIRRLEREG